MSPASEPAAPPGPARAGAILRFDAAGRLVRPRPGVAEGHLAFACAYNDRGYRDVCSERVWGQNTAEGRCPDACREYLDERPTEDDFPCYESVLFRSWRVWAGSRRSPVSPGRPYAVQGARPGSLAVLTTKRPFVGEGERYVFGLLQVAGVVSLPLPGPEGRDGGRSDVVVGDPEGSLALDPRVRPLFWEHFPGTRAERSAWGPCPFRYLDGRTLAAILADVRAGCERVGDERALRVLAGHVERCGGPAR